MIKYFILSNYYFDKNVIKEVNYDTIVMWYNTSYISFKNTLYEAFNEIMSYRIGTQKKCVYY